MVSRFTQQGAPADPRNTQAWKRLRAQVYEEETHCWQCGMWVNQSLHRTHPMSRTVDHLKPIARGGAGVPDRSGVRLAHRRCNGRRGHRPERLRPRELSVDVSAI